MKPVGGIRDLGIVRTYLFVSVGFGLAVGSLFPAYAGFFVTYRSGGARLFFTAGCLAAGALVGFLSFLIGRLTVLRFIADMARRLDRFSEGDANLGEDLSIRSSDCLGDLAAAFNRFKGKLRDLAAGLRDIARSSELVGQELAANSTETSAASEQIAGNMALIDEQTKLVLAEIAEVDEARQVINEASELVSANIDRQSESLTDLSARIEESVQALGELSSRTGDRLGSIRDILGAAGDGIADIARISDRMRGLHGELELIRTHAASIDDVAERIAVLGINASIEAARSSAAGRGFSVVSQEIRKLAAIAKENASAIGGRLNAVVESARTGAELVESGSAGLNRFLERVHALVSDMEGVSRRLVELAGASQSMLDAHFNLVRVSIDVTNSMVTLKDGSESIELSMGVLVSTAEENMRAVAEISEGMKEISADVRHLEKVGLRNAEGVRALRDQIAKLGA